MIAENVGNVLAQNTNRSLPVIVASKGVRLSHLLNHLFSMLLITSGNFHHRLFFTAYKGPNNNGLCHTLYYFPISFILFEKILGNVLAQQGRGFGVLTSRWCELTELRFCLLLYQQKFGISSCR